jgi:hypothetical protein
MPALATANWKNEAFWAELESLPIFDGKKYPQANEAKVWLEKLQQEGKLRQIDIMNVVGLLEHAINYNPKK